MPYSVVNNKKLIDEYSNLQSFTLYLMGTSCVCIIDCSNQVEKLQAFDVDRNEFELKIERQMSATKQRLIKFTLP